jgi:hypothetical protein
MASEEGRDELTDEHLLEWDRIARESLNDREHRTLGSVARDRKIRRLIEELQRLRRVRSSA